MYTYSGYRFTVQSRNEAADAVDKTAAYSSLPIHNQLFSSSGLIKKKLYFYQAFWQVRWTASLASTQTSGAHMDLAGDTVIYFLVAFITLLLVAVSSACVTGGIYYFPFPFFSLSGDPAAARLQACGSIHLFYTPLNWSRSKLTSVSTPR